jgi:SpoVK/Ycf46/Vps4 family AAA+-type ATPase
MDEFGHLTPSAREVAKQNDDVRIARILGDRWIGYSAAEAALKRLEWLLRHPKKIRMPNLLLVGPTNNGKTMIIERFGRDHARTPSVDPSVDTAPVLIVQTPIKASIKLFFNACLDALGAPERPTEAIEKKQQQVMYLLKKVGVKLLIIDEIQNVLVGRNTQFGEILNFLKYLGNELQIPIVAVGVKTALQVIHSDPQLANRFEPFPLRRWKYNDELCSLLDAFERILPLRKTSGLANPVFTQRVVAMSEGVLGEIATLVTRCGEMAIRSGTESISVKMLDELDYIPPSQRPGSAGEMGID